MKYDAWNAHFLSPTKIPPVRKKDLRPVDWKLMSEKKNLLSHFYIFIKAEFSIFPGQADFWANDLSPNVAEAAWAQSVKRSDLRRSLKEVQLGWHEF